MRKELISHTNGLTNETTRRYYHYFELGGAQSTEEDLPQEGVYHERKDESLRVDHLDTKQQTCM